MKVHLVTALVAIGIAGLGVPPAAHAQSRPRSTGVTLDQMPASLETTFALSAAPPALRAQATVYLLDPRKGYYRTQTGASGVTCLVRRTDWALSDFRDDIYIPLCYDAAGTKTYLQVIMDEAALRARGMTPVELKREVERRYGGKSYRAPAVAGVSYMEAPVFRTIGPPDMQVHTMVMPHVMFYAPSVTNEQLGAHPDLRDPASLLHPFIDRQGNAEQSYIIQLTGQTEKAAIVAREKSLIDALCDYRDVLCVAKSHQ